MAVRQGKLLPVCFLKFHWLKESLKIRNDKESRLYLRLLRFIHDRLQSIYSTPIESPEQPSRPSLRHDVFFGNELRGDGLRDGGNFLAITGSTVYSRVICSAVMGDRRGSRKIVVVTFTITV